jgi:hypothetical protein
MTTQLSWLQAARLNVGDRVVFVAAHDIFPEALVPAGTRATVTEQGLNEISSALAVTPDDVELQAKLAEWDGEIILSPPLDREGSGNREPAWSEASPLAKVAMTFAEFVSTRRWCEDLSEAIADARWQGEPPAKGNLYLDGTLYIEEVQAHWPDATKAQGKWHLLIERNETICDDLESLERKLFAWAMANGYGD